MTVPERRPNASFHAAGSTTVWVEVYVQAEHLSTNRAENLPVAAAAAESDPVLKWSSGPVRLTDGGLRPTAFGRIRQVQGEDPTSFLIADFGIADWRTQTLAALGDLGGSHSRVPVSRVRA